MGQLGKTSSYCFQTINAIDMSLLTDKLKLMCYVLYETKELLTITKVYITIINILIFIVSIVIVIIIIIITIITIIINDNSIIIIATNVITIVSLPYLLNRHCRYVKLNTYLLQFKRMHMLYSFTFSLFKSFNIYELK